MIERKKIKIRKYNEMKEESQIENRKNGKKRKKNGHNENKKMMSKKQED